MGGGGMVHCYKSTDGRVCVKELGRGGRGGGGVKGVGVYRRKTEVGRVAACWQTARPENGWQGKIGTK